MDGVHEPIDQKQTLRRRSRPLAPIDAGPERCHRVAGVQLAMAPACMELRIACRPAAVMRGDGRHAAGRLRHAGANGLYLLLMTARNEPRSAASSAARGAGQRRSASTAGLRRRELACLNAVAEVLNRSTEIGAALTRTLSLVAEVLGLHSGWVWLLDESGDYFPAAG